MSVHSFHPPEQEHLVLKDDCPRCLEHADEPWYTVDHERLLRLVDKTLAWEDGRPGDGPESDPERVACQRISDVLNACRAMYQLRSRSDVVDALVHWSAA